MASSKPTSETVPATFVYQVVTHPPTSQPLTYEVTRPVPAFLCQPNSSARASVQWHAALIDVLSIVNAETHEAVISLFSSASPQSPENDSTTSLPCSAPKCNKTATDALKSPSSLLHLSPPTMVIIVHPACSSPTCESSIRKFVAEGAKSAREEEVKQAEERYGEWDCHVCGKEKGKRCVGCGNVAYCGKECQAKDWKEGGHKRYCRRKKIDGKVGKGMGGVGGGEGGMEVDDPEDLPYEGI